MRKFNSALLVVAAMCGLADASARDLKIEKSSHEITLENRFIRAEVVEHGGKISKLIDKASGLNYAVSGSDMDGLDKLRVYEELRNKDFSDGQYQLEIIANDESRVAVRCSYIVQNARFPTKGFELIKVYSLAKNSCQLRIDYTIMSHNAVYAFSPFVHNVFKLHGEKNYAYCQTATGLFCKDAAASGQANNFVGGLSEPWGALISETAASGIVEVVSADKLNEIFFWMGNEQFATMEPLYKKTEFVADSLWKSSSYLIPVQGLKSCHFAAAEYAGGFTAAENGTVLKFFPVENLGRVNIAIFKGNSKLSEYAFDAEAGKCVTIPATVGEKPEALRIELKTAKFSRTHHIFAASKPVAGMVKSRSTVYKDAAQTSNTVNYAKAFTDKPETYVCPDIPVFSKFEILSKLPKSTPVSLVVEVPEGIRFINPVQIHSRPMKESQLTSAKISIENKAYTRYEVSQTNQQALLFSTTDWPPGKTGNIYYYAKWNGGEQPRQTLPVTSIHIEKAPSPKRLISNLGWMPSIIHQTWPDFHKTMKYIGVNTVCGTSTDNEHPELLSSNAAKAREYGLYYAANFSPFAWSAAKDIAADKDCRAVSLNGKTSAIWICPSFRCSAFEKDTGRTGSYGKYGITMLWLDTESWHDAAYCFCPRCLERFKKFMAEKYPQMKPLDPLVFMKEQDKYPDYAKIWKEFHIMLGDEIYGAIATKFKQNVDAAGGKADGPFQVGTYSAMPGELYSHFLNIDSLFKNNILNILQPSLYTAGDANMVADKIRKARAFTNNSNITSWLSAGYDVNSECRPEEFRYCMLENFLNGAGGFTVFTWAGCDGMDLKELAETMRMVVPVEDIIMDGKVINGLKTSNRKVKICGLDSGNEKLLLLSEYYGTKNTPVTFELTVTEDCRAVNMRTGETIAILKQGKNSVSVTIPAADRALLLYIGNRQLQFNPKSAADAGIRPAADTTRDTPAPKLDVANGGKVKISAGNNGQYTVENKFYRILFDRYLRMTEIKFIKSGNVLKSQYLMTNFVQAESKKIENLLAAGDKVEIFGASDDTSAAMTITSNRKGNDYDVSCVYKIMFSGNSPLVHVQAEVRQNQTQPAKWFVRLNQWQPLNFDAKNKTSKSPFPYWSCGEPYRNGKLSEISKNSIKPNDWRKGFRWISVYNDKDAFGLICPGRQAPFIYVGNENSFYMNGWYGNWNEKELTIDQYVYVGPADADGKIVGEWGAKLADSENK